MIPEWAFADNISPENTYKGVIEWLEQKKIEFPIFIKSFEAFGQENSHILKLAMSNQGVKKFLYLKEYFNLKLQFQIFIPHYSTIYKIYSIGNYATYISK